MDIDQVELKRRLEHLRDQALIWRQCATLEEQVVAEAEINIVLSWLEDFIERATNGKN